MTRTMNKAGRTPAARNVARLSDDRSTLRLYGIVGDWMDGFTDDDVRDLLDGVEGPLLVQLNSPGGLVDMGMAIYTALREVPGGVTVQVDGLAASMASIIAMAGTVRMHPGSMLMIHNPWNIALGDAEEMRKSAEILDKWRDALVNIYVEKTGQDRDTIQTMMDEETWLTSQEAIEWGFADELVEAGDPEAAAQAMAQLDLSILPHLDTRVAASVARYKIAGNTRGERAAPPSAETSTSTPKEDPTMTKKDGQHASAADPNAADPNLQPGTGTEGDSPATPDPDTVRAEATKAERERVAEIQRTVRSAKLESEFADELIREGVSVADARKRIIDKWADGEGPDTHSAHRIEVGADDRERFQAGAVQAILARAGVSKPDPQNEFRGSGFINLAQAALERAGVAIPRTKDGLIRAAITTSTSDYPNVLEDAMHKLLLDAFNNAPDTWRRWCRVGDLADFRDHHRYKPGSIKNLQKLKEDGELEYGSVPDAEKESISADERGLIVPISHAMMVNDDVGVFTTLARDLGRAGARTIEKAVYDLLISNPTMSDSTALFHTDHSNLASSGTDITVAGVGNARAKIRLQKDPAGNDYIDPRIAFLLVPVEKGDKARQTMASEVDPSKNNRTPNPVRGIAEVVDTPRLSDDSATAWYLIADPADAPIIEVGFVNGEQEPMVEQEEQFTSRGMLFRVTHDWGTAAIGYRGAFKDPGA